MMEICKRCKYKPTCSAASESDFCLNYESRPLTNGDRIRAMTDRELAKWLSEWAGGAPNCDREGEDLKTCRGCWYEWLKEEVTE